MEVIRVIPFFSEKNAEKPPNTNMAFLLEEWDM